MPGPFGEIDKEIERDEKNQKPSGLISDGGKASTEPLEVDIDDDPDAGDDEPPAAAGASRTEKRRERGENFARKAKEAEERAARAEEQARAERDRAQRAESYILQNRQPAGPVKNPFDDQIDDVRNQLGDINRYFGAVKDKMTQGEYDELEKRAYKLKEKEQNLLLDKRDWERNGGRQPQAAPDPHGAALKVALEMSYPDLTRKGNEYMMKFADKRMAERVQAGEPNDFGTVKKAMDDAMVEFKLTKRPGPSASERAKFSGAPGRAGAGGEKPNTITVTPDEQKMAIAMYGKQCKGDRKKAIAMWAKNVGVRARASATG